jgi:peptidoglycan/xylan/chitin deacetylase (PgdA/CDA1 family)
VTQFSWQHLSEPPGRRQRAAEALERFGVLPLLQILHDRGRRPLTVLAYHRVTLPRDLEEYPLDLDVVSTSPDEFEWQMRFLRENLQPVSLGHIIRHIERGEPLPRRAVAVTFDDGFNDTYRHAFPALRRHAIPATVFLSTGYIDSGEPFWFERAALLMMRAPPGTIALPSHEHPLPAGDSLRQRHGALRLLQRYLQDQPDAHRKALLDEWVEHVPGRRPSPADAARPLDWAQVREMAAAGVDFGTHSVTHANLAKLPDSALTWELANSKLALENQLGRDIDTLAYPIGTRASFDARVMGHVREAGYRLAMSFVLGANWQQSLSPFELRRQAVSLTTSRSCFKALVSVPAWVS